MIEILDAGLVPYQEAENWQRELTAKRLRDEIPDTLLLLEHPPVVTMGRREATSDLRISREILKKAGIDLVQTDRGGRLTYHGPGQLVGYFIFRLGKKSIPDFVGEVEELLIQLLQLFGLTSHRDPEHPGVWIGRKKIASLGLHVDHGITRHGFALNVNCDLTPFGYIYPCGVRDCGVTSLQEELGYDPTLPVIKRKVGELPFPYTRAVLRQTPDHPVGSSDVFDIRKS